MEDDVIQAQLPYHSSDLTNFLYTQCPDLEKLFPLNGDLQRYIQEFLANRYVAIKGQIQSGKTSFMICAGMLMLLAGMDVVIVLRNSNSDLQQIYARLTAFQKLLYQECQQSFDIATSKKPAASARPQIVLALANGISLQKVFSILQKDYVLIIDEADYVDSGTLTRKAVVLPMLKAQAHCVLGVSATVMDLLGKESLLPKDLVLLSPCSDYKGIPHILGQAKSLIPPGAKYSSKVDANLLENDPYLLEWVQELLDEPAGVLPDGTLHPNVALVTICDTVEPCRLAREEICCRFPRVTVVDHHADGIVIQKGIIEDTTRSPISEVLQSLSEEKDPIVIFAGDIAGRGVSYVSSDYRLHLTHQRLIVSASCTEPELMQKIRLCGVYKDHLPLKLVTTESILCDLRKAYFKQEELVGRVREVAESFAGECREFFKTVVFEKDKMSGRQITKDTKARPELQLVDFSVGMVYDESDARERGDYPQKEYERLVNRMFPKWAKESGATNISRFMDELDPRKEYTHSEMVELCVTTGVGNKNLKNLMAVSNGKSNGYGKIVEVLPGGRYRLYECLIPAHENFFKV
jgi:hypothetical protein